jgi:hypothetical protein
MPAAEPHLRERPVAFGNAVQDVAPVVGERLAHGANVVEERRHATELGAERSAKREVRRQDLHRCVQLAGIPDAPVERFDDGWRHVVLLARGD